MDIPERSKSETAVDNTASGPGFATTHWSVVLSVTGTDTAQARNALEQLCRTYWYPLYAFVRRQGHSVEDAQDLTQEFFYRLLQGEWIPHADPSRGRFRTFLLTALKRFMVNEWRKAGAQRRGAHAQYVPLEFETAETRLGVQPAVANNPEQLYERAWALAVLEQALGSLRREYASAHDAEFFEKLRPTLLGGRESQPYSVLGEQLGLSEGAVKVAVHRLRQRYRERLREVIAQTVLSPQEVEGEMRHLCHVLMNG